MAQTIDKQAVADSFSKAATHYDQFAQLQRDIGDTLLTQLQNAGITADESRVNIVDLGCGTGHFSQELSNKFPLARLTCFDLSSAMLEQVKKRNIKNTSLQQGDIDALPFSESSIDFIYSNLVVQWSDDLQQCLLQVHRSLKDGGRAHISTLLNGSLKELTEAWKQVDKNPHTNSFLSLTSIEEHISNIAFTKVNIKTETRVLAYQSVIEVMRALKGIGANHVHGHKTVQVSGRQLLRQLETGYKPFINKQGLLNLTYEVCYIEVIK